MDAIERKIKKSQLLTDIFGYWPSFHDAEVNSIELQRAQDGSDHPTLRARIYVFEMTREVDDRGFYVLKNHTLVTFLFRGVDESQIKSFNHQNVLWGLEIIDLSSRQLESLKFEVHFVPSFGVEAEFKCKAVEIEAVERMVTRDIRSFAGQSAPRIRTE
ncbi:MAG TPA: Imm50 family immunity protein [Candidatus Angelobacter sp.]|jgi:hypothetical protein